MLPEVVYTPESLVRQPGRLISGLVSDLVASRELAWRLFVRNISAQYRQTMFGYLWAFLPALATTALWCFLHSQKILEFETFGIPYPVFVLTGTVLWQTFVESLNAPLKAINQSRSMLTRTNFPREAILATSVGEVLFSFSIRLLLLVGVLVWFQTALPATVFFVPFGVLAIIGLGFALGLMLVPVGALYQDVGRAITTIVGFWMFLTPVIYPAPTTWPAELVNWINPVSPLLLVTRDWLLSGETAWLPGFFLVSAGTTIVLFFSLLAFRVAMPIMIERMNA